MDRLQVSRKLIFTLAPGRQWMMLQGLGHHTWAVGDAAKITPGSLSRQSMHVQAALGPAMHGHLLPLSELIYTNFLHVALSIKVVELDFSWQLQGSLDCQSKMMVSMANLSEGAAEALDQACSPCHRLQQRSPPDQSSKMHAAASESAGTQRAFKQALPGRSRHRGAQSYPGQHQGTRFVPMQQRAPPHAWACCCTRTAAHDCCRCHA